MRASSIIRLVLAGAALLAGLSVQAVRAQELIQNGGFETGDFTGWSYANQFPSGGSWVPDTGNQVTSVVQNFSGQMIPLPTPGPASGNFYAVTDMLDPAVYPVTGPMPDPAAMVLYQSFTIPTVFHGPLIVSFDMFVNNWWGHLAIDPSGLDYTTGGTFNPNQFETVDILQGNADPFTTTTGEVANLFLGDTGQYPGFDAQGNPISTGYQHYSYDITGDVTPGDTYLLRFGVVADANPFNAGIDNVSVAAAPEPGIAALFASLSGVGGSMLLRRRRLN